MNESVMRKNSTIKYRPDIDGLRGVAVTLVVLFHFFPGVIRGGLSGSIYFL
jgi:peptidoglycan/LPS O-acetylase OafA/YrhL